MGYWDAPAHAPTSILQSNACLSKHATRPWYMPPTLYAPFAHTDDCPHPHPTAHRPPRVAPCPVPMSLCHPMRPLPPQTHTNKPPTAPVHPCESIPTHHGPLPTRPDPFRRTPPFIPSSVAPICATGSPTDAPQPAVMLASRCPALPAPVCSPIGRIHHMLTKGNYAQRVSAGAPGRQ